MDHELNDSDQYIFKPFKGDKIAMIPDYDINFDHVWRCETNQRIKKTLVNFRLVHVSSKHPTHAIQVCKICIHSSGK